MRKVTEAEFTAAMEAAVAERGEDYVYPKDNPDYGYGSECVYQTPAGKPACLIGLAMDKLGLETPEYNAGAQGAFKMMTFHPDARFPESVKRAATAAQYAQDREYPWGEALATYRQGLGAA